MRALKFLATCCVWALILLASIMVFSQSLYTVWRETDTGPRPLPFTKQ